MATLFAPAVASIWLAACDGRRPGVTDPDATAPGSRPPRAIVSDPVRVAAALPRAGSSRPSLAAASGEDVVFISLKPGSFPEASAVEVWNAVASFRHQIQLSDGGLDPVGVPGAVGDTLRFTLWRGTVPMTEWMEVVPVSSPPEVVRSNPARGKRDVPVALSPMVVFSEPMESSTLDATTIVLSHAGEAVPGRVEVSADLLAVTFTPDGALEPEADYLLTIGLGVRDLDGDGLTTVEEVPFATGPADATDSTSTTGSEPPPPCATAPECGRIAFLSWRDGNAEIYTVEPDGSGLTRLTYHLGDDAMPRWSPDGRRIAFISDRAGRYTYDIYVMDSDGSNVVRRTFSGGYTQHPSWSPDGTKIVYKTMGDGDDDLWVVTADGDPEPTPLFETPGWDTQPAWSPDGTRIAFVSDRWVVNRMVLDVFVANADGSGLTPLRMTPSTKVELVHPSWSPNGAELAVVTARSVGVDEYENHIGVMNADGSDLRKLRPTVWGGNTSWSPDGRVITYTSGAPEAPNVSWVSSDGSEAGVIVLNGEDADWGP